MSFDEGKWEAYAKSWLIQSSEVKRLTAEKCVSTVVRAAKLVVESFQGGGKLMICGNGGSAADSQHLATEFTCRLSKDFPRDGLPAIALTTDTSFLTAFPNDVNFEAIFSRQVQALGRPGDVLLGISTSGNSKNVILAFEEAKRRQIKCIALVGTQGSLGAMADVAIEVPTTNGNQMQETHLSLEHILCGIVERVVCPE